LVQGHILFLLVLLDSGYAFYPRYHPVGTLDFFPQRKAAEA
jgi:hypothetical protein